MSRWIARGLRRFMAEAILVGSLGLGIGILIGILLAFA